MGIILFALSVFGGVIVLLLVGTIILPIYYLLRYMIRIMLYLVGIDTFLKAEKIKYDLIKPDPPKVPKEIEVLTEDKVTCNCILSKTDFPNIEKYFPEYKETKK